MEPQSTDNTDSETETTSIPDLEVTIVDPDEVTSDNPPVNNEQTRPRSRFSAIFFILVVIGAAVWSIPEPREEFDGEPAREKPESRINILPTERFKATFYIPDANHSQLLPVEIHLETAPTAEERIYTAVTSLLENENFYLMPKGTSLREVFIYDTTAVLSIDTSFRAHFTGGATEELLAVTAIVNTAVDASESVKSVVILLDDRHEDIFMSHVDISRPFYANHGFDAPTTSERE